MRCELLLVRFDADYDDESVRKVVPIGVVSENVSMSDRTNSYLTRFAGGDSIVILRFLLFLSSFRGSSTLPSGFGVLSGGCETLPAPEGPPNNDIVA
jgi:hypothetical protein